MSAKLAGLVFIIVMMAGCLGRGGADKGGVAGEPDRYLVLREGGEVYEPVYCYVNETGDTIVPPGKYLIYYTDTIRSYGIVITQQGECIAIDREDNELYRVYIYDNGPDYIEEGLFRILDENDNVGFASGEDGSVVIEPRFAFAEPFAADSARVTDDGFIVPFGEYSYWEADEWYYIDKEGNRL